MTAYTNKNQLSFNAQYYCYNKRNDETSSEDLLSLKQLKIKCSLYGNRYNK